MDHPRRSQRLLIRDAYSEPHLHTARHPVLPYVLEVPGQHHAKRGSEEPRDCHESCMRLNPGMRVVSSLDSQNTEVDGAC